MPTNRLANEKSPYLLQHAHNPVDWYPWGDEAFERAKREDKPVFLSIGYSTCHWCHVMERESFESEEIAAQLNNDFVSIKVDREERPDVDRVYMLFVQASTGGGGWPMSVWLTPDRKPFFGGTYFPPDNRWGRAGFKVVLERLSEAWRNERAKIDGMSAKTMQQLAEYGSLGDAGKQIPGKEVFERAYFGFRRAFDSDLGGFGPAPKFPRPSVHNFLVRHHAANRRTDGLEMVQATLEAMVKGGMNDQIGGGFHRYSVDARWFVPHFEKMLYDQAQLAASYVETFQITRDAQYAAAARDILDYVLRDMTDPAGGFYSAEDADSAADPLKPKEKGEGAFYIWSYEELHEALGEKDAEIFGYRYGVGRSGNVEEDPHGEFRGRNIFYQARTVDETAAHAGIPVDECRAVLAASAKKLLEIRASRPRPLRDDKVLAAWNGMMISAFSKAAQVLGEARYEQAATEAAAFVRRHLWNDATQLLIRRYREGEAQGEGVLDDYAFSGLGFLDLYETTFASGDFAFAVRLAERAMELFEDREKGGYFNSANSDLILRLKDDYDGAEPSGNSAMVMLLLRLARMTDREDFRASAERVFRAFSSRLEEAGTGLPQMLVALQFALGTPVEIVLAGPSNAEMLAAIRRHFLPGAVVMRAEECSRPMPGVNGAATVYVCENFACKMPVTTAAELAGLLE
ncbi:MAG: thioredoxin domain-containing protein [Bryobacteraceae bacterium]